MGHEPGTNDVERIRRDPAAFLSGWAEKGALAVVEDLMACAIIEVVPRLEDPRISVRLVDSLGFVIADNGRGMNFAPEPGQAVSHAEYVMTHVYPIPVPDPALVAILQSWTWGDRSCLGPVIGTALAASFRIESQRGGGGWAQEFACGVTVAPASPLPESDRGTTQRVRLDETICGGVPSLTAKALSESLNRLRTLIPKLRIDQA